MNGIPEKPAETASGTEETQGLPDDPVSLEPDQAETESEQAGPPWKKIGLVVGFGVLVAACAAIVTLAATHTSAVTENARAYVNGLVDGYTNGFVDGIKASEDGLFEGEPFD